MYVHTVQNKDAGRESLMGFALPVREELNLTLCDTGCTSDSWTAITNDNVGTLG